jgi:hypothetical protein
MIRSLYKDYFQKSYTFLYPLLGLKKKSTPFKPVQTYVSWPDEISTADKKLICVYEIQDDTSWFDFETKVLLNHPMLDYVQKIDDNKIAYIFDLHSFKNDFQCFLDGKYSNFSTNAKKLISDYYGIHTPEWIYIESFLFPKKYYKSYAEILLVPVATLQKVGELCDKHNPEKETLKTNNI